MYSMWVMTCWPFLSALQMMYPGSGCLLSSYQVAFPIRSQGMLSFFLLWTCRYSLGSVLCAGIMCTMSPGSLLLVTLMGVVIFFLEREFLCYDSAGSFLFYKSLGGAVAILGDDTESSELSVSSDERCSIPEERERDSLRCVERVPREWTPL